jgi:hypothetical protein
MRYGSIYDPLSWIFEASSQIWMAEPISFDAPFKGYRSFRVRMETFGEKPVFFRDVVDCEEGIIVTIPLKEDASLGTPLEPRKVVDQERTAYCHYDWEKERMAKKVGDT